MITNIPARYKTASLCGFKTPTDEHKRLLEFIKLWIAAPQSENIIIVGGVGTGKTFIAYAILHEIAELKTISGYTCFCSDKIKFVGLKQIIDEIKRRFDTKDGEDLRELTSIPILIIDEIGLQYGTDSERIELFELFNERYNNCLPTICLSNMDENGIKKILGLRIADRLFSGAEIFKLECQSMRSKNNG